MKMPKMNPTAYLSGVFNKVRVQLTSVYAKLDDERIEAEEACERGRVTVALNGRARLEDVRFDDAMTAAIAAGEVGAAEVARLVVAAARKAYVASEALRKEMSAKATGGLIPKGIDMPLEAI